MKGRFIAAKTIAEFRKHLILEERSTATVEKYIRDVNAFSVFTGDTEIEKETVIAYKKHLQERYAVRSVNSMLASINSLFAFLGWHDLKVKSLKLQQQVYCPEEKELTKAECDTLNAGENSVSFSYMGAQADIKVYARDIPKIVSAKLVKSPKTLDNLMGAVIELEFENGTIKQIEIFEYFPTMFNPHQIDGVAVTSVGNIFMMAENNCDCFGSTEFSINFNYCLNGNFYNLKAEKADGLDLNDAISAFQDLYCHSGGTSTCTERAKCSICGKEYGNFTHKLEYHARIEATYNSDGNIEYWSCSECGKLFGDLACKTEIQATDIVLPKITITERSFLDDEVAIVSRSDIIPVGATFDVSKIVSDLQDVISYIDVKLIDSNGREILNSDGNFLVKIKIPNEYERKKFKVLQENEDGNLTVIDAIYENGYISFNTNYSGRYMIIKANYVPGDINGDGVVNKKDSLLMKMYLADNSTDIDKEAADVFHDGVINKKDSLYLKQFLAGLDVELGA